MDNATATSVWQKSKLLVKGIIISVLILLLLIPAYFVKELIQEREQRQKEAVAEVSGKWASSQNILGPVLVLPYYEVTKDEHNVPTTYRKLAYLLPEKLDIRSSVTPEKRYRGIYEVMLYTGEVNMRGRFAQAPLQQLNLEPENVIWNEAYVCMSITDARGLREEMKLQWNDSTLQLSPSVLNNNVMREGFSAAAPLTYNDTAVQFNATIHINGSEQLLFTPVGKETTVQMESTWPDPSFTGSQLPQTPVVNNQGFTANWHSLAHTRPFPQAWKDAAVNMSPAAFGVDLFVPVNGYQKTLRSIKYAILCILLTFTAFFLIETTHKKSVHPVQYALIGFALILFYTLLLSFSEYIGFNGAYAVAGISTVALITWFVKGILGSMRASSLLMIVLVMLYSYIFTILQLQDYALIMGSVGLFLTLAIVMRFSRKIQW